MEKLHWDALAMPFSWGYCWPQRKSEHTPSSRVEMKKCPDQVWAHVGVEKIMTVPGIEAWPPRP